MAQIKFRKKFNMIAFDQHFTIFEHTRTMSVNTPDVRKERFMDNFMNAMGTSAFVTSMFKGCLASSETAKSIMETQTLVADIGYDCIVKEALNLDLSPEKVTILQGHLNLVPLSITPYRRR